MPAIPHSHSIGAQCFPACPGWATFAPDGRGYAPTPDPRAPRRAEPFTEPQEYATLVRKAAAYDMARARLKRLHTRMAEDRERWANNTDDPCAVARAVAYQGDMHVVARIIHNIETIAGDRP